MRAAGAIERSKPKESPLTRERLFRDHACLKSCAARVVGLSERGIELGRTAFYPRGGSQPGDTGALRRADGTEVRFVDARQGEGPETVVHVLAPGRSREREIVAIFPAGRSRTRLLFQDFRWKL